MDGGPRGGNVSSAFTPPIWNRLQPYSATDTGTGSRAAHNCSNNLNPKRQVALRFQDTTSGLQLVSSSQCSWLLWGCVRTPLGAWIFDYSKHAQVGDLSPCWHHLPGGIYRFYDSLARRVDQSVPVPRSRTRPHTHTECSLEAKSP